MRRAIDFGFAPILAAGLVYWLLTAGIRQGQITRTPVGGGPQEVIGQQYSITFYGILAGLLAATIAVYVIVRLAKLLRGESPARG